MKPLILSTILGMCIVPNLLANLHFASELQKVDAAADAKEVKVEFPFKNTGNAEVVIEKFDAPCSCMFANIEGGKKLNDGTVVIAPGEEGKFSGRFELGNFKGTVDKKIVVWLEGDSKDKPSLALTTQVNIPYLIAAFPQSLIWKVGDTAEEKVIEIKVDHSTPIKVIKHVSSSPNFDYQFITNEEGKSYSLRVKPKSTKKVSFAAIRLTTDSKNPRYKTVQTFMTVKPDKKK